MANGAAEVARLGLHGGSGNGGTNTGQMDLSALEAVKQLRSLSLRESGKEKTDRKEKKSKKKKKKKKTITRRTSSNNSSAIVKPMQRFRWAEAAALEMERKGTQQAGFIRRSFTCGRRQIEI